MRRKEVWEHHRKPTGAIMEAAIDSQFQQYTDGEYRGNAYHLLDIKTAKNQLIVVTQVTIR